MATNTYVDPILAAGDMVANIGGFISNNGNPGDPNFGINLPDVQALGEATDTYRFVWSGNTSSQGTEEEFTNGQFWTLEVYDSASDPDNNPNTGNDGWSSVPGYTQLSPRQDLVGGLGSGDEYIVFIDNQSGEQLLYNINGGLPSTPTDLLYLATDEQGDPVDGDGDGDLDFFDAYLAAPCFASDVRILTQRGMPRIRDIEVGDQVMTRDNGLQPVRWIGSRHLDAQRLRQQPNMRPIRIRQNALGADLPRQDTLVSPQHRVVVRSTIVSRMFDAPEVMIAAKHLVGFPGIEIAQDVEEVTYCHMLFDRHEVVLANGAEMESLHLGKEALRSLPAETVEELLDLFPELLFFRIGAKPVGAMPFVGGKKGKRLANRHVRNRRELIESKPLFGVPMH